MQGLRIPVGAPSLCPAALRTQLLQLTWEAARPSHRAARAVVKAAALCGARTPAPRRCRQASPCPLVMFLGASSSSKRFALIASLLVRDYLVLTTRLRLTVSLQFVQQGSLLGLSMLLLHWLRQSRMAIMELA